MTVTVVAKFCRNLDRTTRGVASVLFNFFNCLGPGVRVNGYNIVRWTENGVTYWAISDVEAKELETFAQLFRTSRNEL